MNFLRIRAKSGFSVRRELVDHVCVSCVTSAVGSLLVLEYCPSYTDGTSIHDYSPNLQYIEPVAMVMGL